MNSVWWRTSLEYFLNAWWGAGYTQDWLWHLYSSNQSTIEFFKQLGSVLHFIAQQDFPVSFGKSKSTDGKQLLLRASSILSCLYLYHLIYKIKWDIRRDGSIGSCLDAAEDGLLNFEKIYDDCLRLVLGSLWIAVWFRFDSLLRFWVGLWSGHTIFARQRNFTLEDHRARIYV